MGLVTEAFDVRELQVFGLPAWATADYYDVACKDTEAVAPEAPISRMRSGIQALLADRFHRERYVNHRGANCLLHFETPF